MSETTLLSSPDALIQVAQRGAVRVLTLNRPAALNSFTQAMHVELRVALDAAAAEPAVRAVLVTGAGRGFCAGQDLNDPAMAPGVDGKPDIGGVIEKNYRPLALTGDKLSAADAERFGLIWQVVDDADLQSQAFALADKLGAMPSAALVATRHAFDAAQSLSLADALALEARVQGDLGRAHDFAEGVAAFQQKRPAVFKDRRA